MNPQLQNPRSVVDKGKGQKRTDWGTSTEKAEKGKVELTKRIE